MSSGLLIVRRIGNQRNQTCCWLSSWRWASALLPVFWDISVCWGSPGGWRKTVRWGSGQFSCWLTDISDLKLQPKWGFISPEDFKEHHHWGLTLPQITQESWVDWMERVREASSPLRDTAIPYLLSALLQWHTGKCSDDLTRFHFICTAGAQRGVEWHRWQGLDIEEEFEAEHTEIRSVRKPGSQMTCILIPKCKTAAKPMQRDRSQYTNLSGKGSFLGP